MYYFRSLRTSHKNSWEFTEIFAVRLIQLSNNKSHYFYLQKSWFENAMKLPWSCVSHDVACSQWQAASLDTLDFVFQWKLKCWDCANSAMFDLNNRCQCFSTLPPHSKFPRPKSDRQQKTCSLMKWAVYLPACLSVYLYHALNNLQCKHS